MLKRIFVNVDDVLNDFTMHALRLMGCPANSVYPTDVGYDIVAACNRLQSRTVGWRPNEFWAYLPEEAWSEALSSPECSWLLSECASIVGQENVFLCTSATTHPSSLSGKLKWIHRYLPTWIHRQYIITPHKYLLARPDTLLIDDAPKQCEDFRRGGGEVIMVPRPWNACRTWSTEGYIRASLGCYSGADGGNAGMIPPPQSP